MREVLKKAIAILVVMLMLVNSSALTLISAAADNIEKNNCSFDVYFKDENGNKVKSIDAKMNEEDLKLYIQISVKQQGLFNGDIVLNDANFKFKPEFTDNSISKIEDNKVYLNQINAGETKEIEVGIELLTDSSFDVSLINKESKIGLEGIYRDSKEKDISVTGERTVQINMVSPYTDIETDPTTCIDLNQEVITNKIANYNGEEKRIIQVEVTSGIKGNLTPIKTSKIQVQAPMISNKYPETIVTANKNLVTNGKSLTQDNWNYDKEKGIATIEVENTPSEDNKIVWTKNGEDKYIVTFIYDKDVEIEEEKIETNSEIELYENGQTKVEATAETELDNEEKDGIVRTEVEQSENSIYKGKIYSGVSRDITYTTVIGANLANTVNEVNVTENEQQINGKNIDSTYKQTIINKANMENVLGEEGTITILNGADATTIATINDGLEEDENGNIVVTYPEGIKAIKIITSEVKNTGDIRITTTKEIGQIGKEISKDATEIETKVEGTTKEENIVEIPETESKIELKETTTEATLQVNKTELSTMSTNDVEMRVVLKSRDENNDLYENPTLRIELPTTIEKAEIKSVQLVDEDELKVVSSNVVDGHIIEVQLSGRQTNYKDKAIEGAIVIINADITLNKKAPNSQEKIGLTVTNTEKVATDEKGINFVSYAGLVTVNKVGSYGIEIINNEGNSEATIPLQNTGSTVESEIINNEDNEITDVKVLGTFPTEGAKEGNNLDVTVGEVKVTGAENAKVYYSENENATNDLENKDNNWTETIADGKKVKKYLVEIPTLATKQNVGTLYEMKVNNLQ